MEKENAKMNEDFERLPVYEEEEDNLDELNRQEVRETKENETCKENVESTESADIRIGKYVCIMEGLQNQVGAQRQQIDTAVNLISQMMLSVESGKKQISSEIKELYFNQERTWNAVQQISNRQTQLDAAIDRLQRDDKVQNQQTASVHEVQKLLEETAGKLHEDIGNLEKKNTDILRDSINFQANIGRKWGDELKHYRGLFADSAYDSILEELADLQRKILTCAQAIVKDGGTLMYSTCTVNPGENMDNVHWFLKEYPQFELDDITENLCKELRSDVIEKGCIQFFPGVHDCDGFFIARLKKKA